MSMKNLGNGEKQSFDVRPVFTVKSAIVSAVTCSSVVFDIMQITLLFAQVSFAIPGGS